MDKNPSANVGDTGLISGPGRLHMLQSSLARVPLLLKSACPEPVTHREATPAMRSPYNPAKRKPPLATTRESPHAATKMQCNPKLTH